MELPILCSQFFNSLLKFFDFRVLVSDYARKVLQLFHLSQVLVPFLVDGRQILMVDLLHVTQSFFQIHGISVATSQSIGQLLSKDTYFLLSVDSKSSFVLVLVAQHHIFFSSDWLLIFGDQRSKNHKLFFELEILGSLACSFLLVLISLPLQIIDLRQKVRISEWRSNCSLLSCHWIVLIACIIFSKR
jgi:hypothetical protein